ncbi:MAG: CDP-diacylglycerol--serine O-phosphatidyltransferase [Alphaproteobacteria bacterium]|nr:CDP-diacylglycerol--serine O-phosphatidyltransferase [Alphaproteobacteria bacterium]MBT4084444.1 CDP-diacylglycerol--serine O-phosphatidyltransferase [Alphaproteobacteria bacterium]MBT4544030.1 CDP-diacylglycerol--serine O-phosphatidyltransferase [Alphaproteobacteria bacterium]MBT7744523.1 CDP-diacylglycerol--serine O-phosphatidyltransferase [Alphaproteobacteria bacterium]
MYPPRRRAGPGRSDNMRRPRLRGLPVNSLIPNILTVLAVCAGLTAVRFALAEQWELAVMAIAVAAILDALDGRVARLLKGTSKFGAELDSLSDFVSFGVAPALVLYRWTMSELGGMGWIIVLAYAVCCGLRLARFNTALEDPNEPEFAANFFTGVPAPAAAGLALLPMMISFQVGDDFFRLALVNAVNLAFVAFLMVSQIPTFSFKKMRVKKESVLPVLIVVGLVGAVVASYPWFVLTAICAIYLAIIPVSWRSWQRQEVAFAGKSEPDEDQKASDEQTPSDTK